MMQRQPPVAWRDFEKAILMIGYSQRTPPPDGSTVPWSSMAAWMTEEFTRRGLQPPRDYYKPTLLSTDFRRHREELIEAFGENGARARAYIQSVEANSAPPNPPLNAKPQPNQIDGGSKSNGRPCNKPCTMERLRRGSSNSSHLTAT